MATELPIACTLTGADLRERLRAISGLGRDALVASEAAGRRATLRFERSVRERVLAFVAAESECCAFLGFDLHETSTSIELAITAPAGAEPVLEEIVSAFTAR